MLDSQHEQSQDLLKVNKLVQTIEVTGAAAGAEAANPEKAREALET